MVLRTCSFLFILILSLLGSFLLPQPISADWGNDTITPTIIVTITCSNDTAHPTTYKSSNGVVTGNTIANCGSSSATVTITYCKQADSTGNCTTFTGTGLQKIIHAITGDDTGNGTTVTNPSSATARAIGNPIIYGSTTVCTPGADSTTIPVTITTCYDDPPSVHKVTYTKIIYSSSSNFSIKATATDSAGNVNNSLSAGTSITFTFKNYISGTVFADTNHDSAWQQPSPPDSSSESGYSGGITVTLSGTSSVTTTTNASGVYTFPNLDPGDYTVAITVPTSPVKYKSTTSTPFSLNVNSNATVNFGIVPLYSIQGVVFLDTDKNGVKSVSDLSEAPYNGGESISISVRSISPANGNFSTSYQFGTYSLTDLYAGNYDISIGPPPNGYKITPISGSISGYTINLGASCDFRPSTNGPPTETPLNASCSNGSIIDLDFGITNSNVWYQGRTGDIRLDAGISDPVPSGQKASEEVSGSNSPGIIFSGKETATFGAGNASSKNWVVSNSLSSVFSPVQGVIRTSYSYLSANAGQNPTQLSPDCNNSSGCIPDLSHGVYTSNSDVYFNSTTFSGGNYVFLIKGRLFIKGGITAITVQPGSTATFSVSDDITVNSNVRSIDGFYSTDKNFIINGNNDCIAGADSQLLVNGAIVANAGLTGGKIQIKRDLCGNTSTTPALKINQRLDMILNAPAFIKHPTYIWREVAPSDIIIAQGATPTPILTVTPTPSARRVFITSSGYNGNLKGTASSGLEGADSICQSAADGANNGPLGGIWMAWLSDNTISPALRFITQSSVPYQMITTSGTTTIANNWSDLIDGTLLAGINIDQNKGVRANSPVWTNTDTNGGINSNPSNCNNWTDNSSSLSGATGNSNSTNSNWTAKDTKLCNATWRLYCFEQ